MKKLISIIVLIFLFIIIFSINVLAQGQTSEVPQEEEGVKSEIYHILNLAATRQSTAFNGIPIYLKNAIALSGESRGTGIIKVFNYIKSEEMKKLITLITQNAESVYGEVSKRTFMMELTGIKYNENGFPIRDEKGNYTDTYQSEWMKEMNVKSIEVKYLTEAILKGLFNKDPVVRIECLVLLDGIGPHPMMLNDLLKASGREVNLELRAEELEKEDSGETVGNIDRAFYMDRPRILANKYNYIDIDGEEKQDVPFLMFRRFINIVIALDILYKIEVEQKDSQKGMESISQTTLNSLSQSVDEMEEGEEEPEYISPTEEPEEPEQPESSSNPVELTGEWEFELYDEIGNISFSGENLIVEVEKIDEKYILKDFRFLLDDDSTITLNEEVEIKEYEIDEEKKVWGFDETEATYKDVNDVTLNTFIIKAYFNSEFDKVEMPNGDNYGEFKVKDTDVWLKWRAVKKLSETAGETEQEEDETITEGDTPLNMYLNGISAFRYYGARSLIAFEKVDYSNVTDYHLTEDEKVDIVKSFIKGLENSNYIVKIKIAEFLSKFYFSSESTTETKTLIVQACITSKEMRSALYKELFQLLNNETISNYLNSSETNELKNQMGI